jgi:hypothetical protein
MISISGCNCKIVPIFLYNTSVLFYFSYFQLGKTFRFINLYIYFFTVMVILVYIEATLYYFEYVSL